MKQILKKIFNIILRVIAASALCGFLVLPFLHSIIDKDIAKWIWYPTSVVLLICLFIPNKKMKEQPKFVRIASSGGIVQLLFIISGVFVINYYDTRYNWYWFAFSILALSIPIGCVTFKVWAESRNTYTDEQVKTAKIRLAKYMLFYWFLDLFYMACFNQWLLWQFIFGGLAMLIVFYSLTVAFLSETKTNKWLLLSDFILGMALTIYLIYIIPNVNLQSIVIPIISAVYGGLLTLVGVAWTIKKSNNDRRMEEQQKAKPIVFICNPETTSINKEELIRGVLHSKRSIGTLKNAAEEESAFTLPQIIISNSDYSHVAIRGFRVNNDYHIYDYGQILTKNKICYLKSDFRFEYKGRIEYVAILLQDMLDNIYELELNFTIIKPEKDKVITINSGIETKMTTLFLNGKAI